MPKPHPPRRRRRRPAHLAVPARVLVRSPWIRGGDVTELRAESARVLLCEGLRFATQQRANSPVSLNLARVSPKLAPAGHLSVKGGPAVILRWRVETMNARAGHLRLVVAVFFSIGGKNQVDLHKCAFGILVCKTKGVRHRHRDSVTVLYLKCFSLEKSKIVKPGCERLSETSLHVTPVKFRGTKILDMFGNICSNHQPQCDQLLHALIVPPHTHDHDHHHEP